MNILLYKPRTMAVITKMTKHNEKDFKNYKIIIISLYSTRFQQKIFFIKHIDILHKMQTNFTFVQLGIYYYRKLPPTTKGRKKVASN